MSFPWQRKHRLIFELTLYVQLTSRQFWRRVVSQSLMDVPVFSCNMNMDFAERLSAVYWGSHY